MPTNDNSEGTDSHTIQLRRKLIPIELYAAQEGITRQMIEEYARLGIVQIRRHQGKSFVVELPSSLNPYDDTGDPPAEQISQVEFTDSISAGDHSSQNSSIQENSLPKMNMIEPPKPAEIPSKKKIQLKNPKQITPSKKKSSKTPKDSKAKTGKLKEQTEKKQRGQDTEISADEILQIMTEMPNKSEAVIGKMTQAATKSAPPTRAQTDKLDTSKISTEVPAKQLIRFRQLDKAAQESGLFRQSKKMPWQVAVLSIAAVVIISLSISIAYNTRRNIRINQQRREIDKAYASMGVLYDDSRQANQQLMQMQQQFDQAQQEIVSLQDQLDASITQANVSRNQLYQTMMDFEKEKAENEYRTKVLTEKIQFLLEQLSQSNTNN